MWKKFCLNKCEQFIDYFPYFFEEKEKSSYLEVYKNITGGTIFILIS